MTVLNPWLRAPVVLLRWHLFIMALGIGLLGGAGILVGSVAIDRGNQFNADRRADLATQLQRQLLADRRAQLTAADIRRIARRTAKLERPTSTDLLRAIRRAADVCRQLPRQCARALQGSRAATTTSPVGPAVPAPGRSGPTARAPARKHRPGGSPAPRPEPTPPGGGGPQRPPIDVQTPPSTPPVGPLPVVPVPLVQVCVNGTVAVNCP
jgi:hypothetical protein